MMLNLAELREQYGIKQIHVKRFSQPAASRMERRVDIKLSTPVEYANELGLGMEIKVHPRSPKPDTTNDRASKRRLVSHARRLESVNSAHRSIPNADVCNG